MSELDDIEDDDNPEMTDADFARGRRGAPWLWETADKLRSAAAELRHQADMLEAQADALDAPDIRQTG